MRLTTLPAFLTQKLACSQVATVVLAMASLYSSNALAMTSNQAMPVGYHANQYCTSDIKADVPRGTAHRQFVGDVSCVKQRLDTFTQSTQSTTIRYQAYKAKGWLVYALHEDNEQGLTQAGNFALREALSILYALENNQAEKLPLNADIPATSGIKRPDLWAKLYAVKQTPAFSELDKQIAFSEVKLIWANAEDCERGWRHSREHFLAVERWVDAIEVTALNNSAVNSADYQKAKNSYYQDFKKLEKDNKACSGIVLP